MKKTMWGQYWSSHQRFFKYLCIASKVRERVEPGWRQDAKSVSQSWTILFNFFFWWERIAFNFANNSLPDWRCLLSIYWTLVACMPEHDEIQNIVSMFYYYCILWIFLRKNKLVLLRWSTWCVPQPRWWRWASASSSVSSRRGRRARWRWWS